MTKAPLFPDYTVHPSAFIKEELEAREWTISTLATLMGGDYGVNFVALDFYLTIGPEEPGLRMGSMAVEIANVFGVDPELFVNLERAWLEHPITKALIASKLH